MQKQMFTAAVLVTAVTASSASAATLFSEDWDDLNAASRWSAPISTLENTDLSFDGGVDYAFDYSAIGAPSAPNSTGGTTIGVAMETNTTDAGAVNEGESVAIVPSGFTIPAGDYKLTADVYLFWNGGGGSTEYAGLGVHTDTTSGAPLRFGINQPNGINWQVDSDGDSGTDILRYDLVSGELGLGGYEDIPDGSIPGVVTGPSRVGPFNQWVELAIESVAGIVSFSMNGYVIDSFDNSADTYSGGSIMLSGSDPFNSVNVDDLFGFSNVQVFDNIRVTDGSGALVGDLNGDGFVGIDDLNIVLGNWNLNVPPANPLADPSGDGFVGIDDLNQVLGNWNAGTPPNAGAAVPEPASLALVGVGAAVVMRRRP